MAQQAEKAKASKPTRHLLVLSVAVAINTAVFYGGYYHCPAIPHPAANAPLDSKLYYTLRCTLPPLLVFIAAVAMVGAGRAGTKAVNPLAGHEHLISLQKQFAANTLEQLIAWLVGTGVLMTYIDGEEMRLVPLYCTSFVVGRVLFRIGYGIHPKYRGLGFMVNVTSGTFILGLVLYLMFTRGLMFGIETADLGAEAGMPGGKVEL